jgi:murein endopeptidase
MTLQTDERTRPSGPSVRKKGAALSALLLLITTLVTGVDSTHVFAEDWDLPCAPESSYVDSSESAIDPQICADWNPDFGIRGAGCCMTKGRTLASLQTRRGRSRRGRSARASCSLGRAKASFCDEMTTDQRIYWESVNQGRLAEPLAFLSLEMRKTAQQSFCTVNNGFLAYGLPVIPTDKNRIYLKSGERCLNFGTSRLVAMTEWLGRRVGDHYSAPEYSAVKLVVGHLSAPRGGCITRPGGRRSHASHTSGRDIDLAFFNPRPNLPSATLFGRDFDPESNWWLIQQAFKNPFACVKDVFLDRKLIRKLAQFAGRETPEEWARLSPFIKHVKGHRDHLHFRVGDAAGEAGCGGEGLDSDFDLDEWLEESGEGQGARPIEALQGEEEIDSVTSDASQATLTDSEDDSAL